MRYNSQTLPPNVLRMMPAFERKDIGKAGQLPEEIQERIDIKSERDLQNLIANELIRRGIPICRQRMDKKSTVAMGWPDFSFPFQGKFVAFEVKVGSNKQTPEQKEMESKIKENGGVYFVIRSFDEALRALKILA